MLHRQPLDTMRYALFLLILTVSFTGCTDDPRDRTTVLLFDVSSSVRSDALLTRYRSVIDEVIATAQPGDYVVGDRINADSRAEAHLALDGHLPRPKSGENSHFFKQRLEVARDTLRQQADSLLSAPAASCTDLLGAFDLAARLLGGSGAAEKRTIVASDMVQTCGDVNFHRTDLSEEAISALIEKERAAGRLPDLAGVSVWVAGAGTNKKIAPERRAAIERFWQAYFEAAGAQLTSERYAPTLLHWS